MKISPVNRLIIEVILNVQVNNTDARGISRSSLMINN